MWWLDGRDVQPGTGLLRDVIADAPVALVKIEAPPATEPPPPSATEPPPPLSGPNASRGGSDGMSFVLCAIFALCSAEHVRRSVSSSHTHRPDHHTRPRRAGEFGVLVV